MANTQTTVPSFVSSQVLTAAQMMNSAATGVPVFATTVTRDAGFGGAGEKVLAEGQLCYLESTNVVQYYDGAAWATLAPAPAVSSGLTLIAKTTLTAATQHNLLNVFSASYDHYSVRFTNFSVTTGGINMRYGTSGTPDTGSNYSNNGIYNDDAQVSTTANRFNSSSNSFVNNQSTNMGTFVEISSPFLTQKTTYTVSNSSLGGASIIGNLIRGTVNTATSYTDLVIFSTGDISGVISIYGLANS
jgi:hypothetical protein